MTLHWHRLSLADAREPSPAPLVQRAQRQLGVDPSSSRLLPAADGETLDDTEMMLAAYATHGYDDAVNGRFPWLAAGRDAQRERDAPVFTRFDGWIHPRSELAIVPEGEVMSAQKLETLARCPYRYFLRYVLHVQPPEERHDVSERWLQPVEIGRLLHDLLSDFMARLQQRGERPHRQRHGGELEEMLNAEVGVWAEKMGGRDGAAYRADINRLLRACDIFLGSEEKRMAGNPALVPHAFEFSFGGREESADEQGRAQVIVKLTERISFALQGRIDRVDLLGGVDLVGGADLLGEFHPGGRPVHEKANANSEAPRAELEIWDYKTGSTFGFDDENLLADGLNLQWALYAYALQQLWPNSLVSRAGYYFIGERGLGRTFAETPPEPAVVGAVLEPLFDMVRGGVFLHVQKKDACRFCDYRAVCASERKLPRDLAAMRDAGESRVSVGDGIPPALEKRVAQWLEGLQPELDLKASLTRSLRRERGGT